MVGETTPRRQPVDGDIVVTKVADHYQMARVQADGRPWASIQALDRLADALSLACRLISGSQRVFLFTHDGLLHRIAIDCAHVH